MIDVSGVPLTLATLALLLKNADADVPSCRKTVHLTAGLTAGQVLEWLRDKAYDLIDNDQAEDLGVFVADPAHVSAIMTCANGTAHSVRTTRIAVYLLSAICETTEFEPKKILVKAGLIPASITGLQSTRKGIPEAWMSCLANLVMTHPQAFKAVTSAPGLMQVLSSAVFGDMTSKVYEQGLRFLEFGLQHNLPCQLLDAFPEGLVQLWALGVDVLTKSPEIHSAGMRVLARAIEGKDPSPGVSLTKRCLQDAAFLQAYCKLLGSLLDVEVSMLANAKYREMVALTVDVVTSLLCMLETREDAARLLDVGLLDVLFSLCEDVAWRGLFRDEDTEWQIPRSLFRALSNFATEDLAQPVFARWIPVFGRDALFWPSKEELHLEVCYIYANLFTVEQEADVNKHLLTPAALQCLRNAMTCLRSDSEEESRVMENLLLGIAVSEIV